MPGSNQKTIYKACGSCASILLKQEPERKRKNK